MNKLFPVVILDDFLENPDEIRKLGLEMDFVPNDGRYPGKRTESIHLTNKKLYDYLATMFFSVFYDYLNPVKWNIDITFQLVEPYDDDEDSYFNKGWIHTDTNRLLAGILYLTPNADLNSGTSIYMQKNKKTSFEKLVDYPQPEKIKLYLHGKKSDDYVKKMDKFHSKFIETVNVKNVYNRLLAFDANTWHAAQNFQTHSEPRLIVNFFVQRIESPSRPPLVRNKDIKFKP